MGKSYKTAVIEAIFDERYDPIEKRPVPEEVKQGDVLRHIEAYNAKHSKLASTRNIANFFKDIVRNRQSFNANWPSSVFERGWTARQQVGDGLSFIFVPLRDGQTEAFPYEAIPPPLDASSAHVIESISLPPQSRRLGREDESWLTQVATRLRLIETHFAVKSTLKVSHIDHLQMNVKLSTAEVDSLYLGFESSGSRPSEFIIACEAKGRRDDILISQMIGQIRAVFAMPKITQDIVVPVAMKTVGPSLVQVVEFEPVRRETVASLDSIRTSVNALYKFEPPVEGVR